MCIPDLSFQLPAVAWNAAIFDGKVNVSGFFALDPIIRNLTCDNESMMIDGQHEGEKVFEVRDFINRYAHKN